MDAFDAKIDRSGGPDACWPWTGFRSPQGYGKFARRTGRKVKVLRAHREAMARSGVMIPPGMLVLHHCDNPPCCNPRHLYVGTDKDNARDAILRGRSVLRRGSRPGQRTGEKNGFAKLSVALVIEARRLHTVEKLSNVVIGRRLGVAPGTISDLLTGKTWTSVPWSP